MWYLSVKKQHNCTLIQTEDHTRNLRVRILQFVVLFVRKGNKNSNTSVVIPADSPVDTQVAPNSPFQMFFFFFLSIPFYIKRGREREREVWSATVRLSWFNSKRAPLKKPFKLSSLLSSCWGLSVECISWGWGHCLSRVFYCTEKKVIPDIPVLKRREEEKLRKMSEPMNSFSFWWKRACFKKSFVWRMVDEQEWVKQRWVWL